MQATGNIQPTTEVEVSSERSGVIRTVNVKANSLVKKGDVLAELDTERLRGGTGPRARPSLAAAEARLRRCQGHARSRSRSLFKRAERLSKQGISSTQDLDTARAAQARAEAGVVAAEADIAVAKAELAMQETDITKTRILSPVDGIVLKRDAEPGQTVASSLQAPVLFTLAEDLARMQLEADVDEADIGAVKDGPEGELHRRCLSRPELSGGDRHHRILAQGDRQRRDLQGGADGGQQRPAAAARHDGDGADRDAGSARMRWPFPTRRCAMRRRKRGEVAGLQRHEPVHSAHAAQRTSTAPAADGERTLYVLENGVPKAVTVHAGVTDGKDDRDRLGRAARRATR